MLTYRAGEIAIAQIWNKDWEKQIKEVFAKWGKLLNSNYAEGFLNVSLRFNNFS